MKRDLLTIEALTDFHFLYQSAHKAYKSKRWSNGQLKASASLHFMMNLEDELVRLKREILNGVYQPGEFNHFWICDRKPRFISAAPFRDRVVHHALTHLMHKRLDRYADAHSYACRAKYGLHKAVRYCQTQCRRYPWSLRLDIAHYFENIPHEALKKQVRRLFKGNQVLRIVDQFIEHAPQGCAQGRGIPIGNLTSQHFANMYLGQLDHAIRQNCDLSAYLRYMDDLVFFGKSKKELDEVHTFVAHYLWKFMKLNLKSSATLLSPTRLGVPFLGFRIFPHYIRFDRSRMKRYRRKRRMLDRLSKKVGYEETVRVRSEALSAWAKVADTYTMRRRHAERVNTKDRKQ